MSHPASFLWDLTQGIAALLTPQGFGFLDPNATHPLYVAKLPGVEFGPAHCAALTVAPLTDEPQRNQSETRLSFLMRSAADDITDVWAIESALKNGLAGRFPVTLTTGIGVTSLDFRGGAPLGQDDGNRWIQSANYVTNHERVTAHRL